MLACGWATVAIPRTLRKDGGPRFLVDGEGLAATAVVGWSRPLGLPQPPGQP